MKAVERNSPSSLGIAGHDGFRMIDQERIVAIDEESGRLKGLPTFP
jgi:hypothetical protein